MNANGTNADMKKSAWVFHAIAVDDIGEANEEVGYDSRKKLDYSTNFVEYE